VGKDFRMGISKRKKSALTKSLGGGGRRSYRDSRKEKGKKTGKVKTFSARSGKSHQEKRVGYSDPVSPTFEERKKREKKAALLWRPKEEDTKPSKEETQKINYRVT